MTPVGPPPNQFEFAHADFNRSGGSRWKLGFRIVRWVVYAALFIAVVMILHKTPPPRVETSPQAAERAEQKLEDAERAVASGQPATLHMDETEVNSFLASHLDLPGNAASKAQAVPEPQRTPVSSAPTQQDVEQMRSNVRDFKIELIDDRAKAYVVFDVHGKDMTLRLEGHLRAQNGYLDFQPLSGQIGSLPIPQSSLESAVRYLTESPENREKLKLPPQIADLRIENGEVVASYR